MRTSIARQHAEWLSLIEPHGQFLTVPVLCDVFPQGLDPVDANMRARALENIAHVLAAKSADRRALQTAWVEWLLRDVLHWGSEYVEGAAAAQYTHSLPEYGTSLHADGVLLDQRTKLPRVLVSRYSAETPLDDRVREEGWSASPVDRMIALCRASGVKLGLVTNGDLVSLVWAPLGAASGYATWPTSLFAESRERALFASFVSVLHARRFFGVPPELQLEALFTASAAAQYEVTNQLGLQVRKAVELLVTAISRSDHECGGVLLRGIPPSHVYEAALTVMMRIVVLLYAEERGLFPLDDEFYTQQYAISTLREQLDEQRSVEGQEPLERRSTGWCRLLATFRAVYSGVEHDRMRLPAYGGRLFDPERYHFLTPNLRVDDLSTLAMLEAVQTLTLREGGTTERRRLSFKTLDVEQIGHVYERLLDHNAIRVDEVYLGLVGSEGNEAERPLSDIESAAARGEGEVVPYLAAVTGKSERALQQALQRGRALLNGEDPERMRLLRTACENNAAISLRVAPYAYLLREDLHGLPIVFRAGGLVVTKTRARRETGTEYTPRSLAEEIVLHALEPLVYSPGAADGAPRDAWKLRTSQELLNLKICDPACGSGAFLVATARYLSERLLEAWMAERVILEIDEDATLRALRTVVECCIYGVDRDHLAVEMAKLSLWLLTLARDQAFTFIDHAIREGDSLIGISALDQLRHLDLDVAHGKALHQASLFVDVRYALDCVVQEASEKRRQLERLPMSTIADADAKARLQAEVDTEVAVMKLIADAVAGVALRYGSSSERERDAAFRSLGERVAKILRNDVLPLERERFIAELRADAERDLNVGRPANAPMRKPLHWPLEFPEVLTGTGHYFDAMIGNPPFLGGYRITGALGTDYREMLTHYLAGNRRGSADLVAYFFLRAYEIALRVGFLATNTIAQGDTREVGIDVMLEGSKRIVRAVRSRPWPGAASLQVAQIWLAPRDSKEQAVLDGIVVERGISNSLTARSRINGRPFRLFANNAVVFAGSYPFGMGFLLTADEVNSLINANSRNADVIRPYLNAEDVCTRPDCSPSRFVIDFGELSQDEAARYREPFERVRLLVYPERQRNNRALYRERWWQFAERRPGLLKAIHGLHNVIVLPFVSKYIMPVRVQNAYVFASPMNVFAREEVDILAVLSSTVHFSWATERGSTLETRLRYTPTDCFETFALPPLGTRLRELGAALSEHRSAMMLRGNAGITKTYNRFHSSSEKSNDVAKLREIHVAIDEAVLAAYGWDDLVLGYDFRETPQGARFTLKETTRSEILDRLLELNHQRYHQEAEAGLHATRRHRNSRRAVTGRRVDTAQQLALAGSGTEEHQDDT